MIQPVSVQGTFDVYRYEFVSCGQFPPTYIKFFDKNYYFNLFLLGFFLEMSAKKVYLMIKVDGKTFSLSHTTSDKRFWREQKDETQS